MPSPLASASNPGTDIPATLISTLLAAQQQPQPQPQPHPAQSGLAQMRSSAQSRVDTADANEVGANADVEKAYAARSVEGDDAARWAAMARGFATPAHSFGFSLANAGANYGDVVSQQAASNIASQQDAAKLRYSNTMRSSDKADANLTRIDAAIATLEQRTQDQLAKATSDREAAAILAADRVERDRLETKRLSFEAAENRQNRLDVAGMTGGIKSDAAAEKAAAAEEKRKQLPVGAAKLQDDHLENITIANSMNANLAEIHRKISGGEINLGIYPNTLAKAKLFTGLGGDAESTAFGEFVNTLEAMRNDSLRLNKGVQTEGDAQRAWNEVMTHLNDKTYVLKRLETLQQKNAQAAEIKKRQINTLRKNYNAGDLDFKEYDVLPATTSAQAETFNGHARPAGFSDAQWSQYKAAQGGQ